MLQALGELMQIQEFFDCDSAATYYAEILSEDLRTLCDELVDEALERLPGDKYRKYYVRGMYHDRHIDPKATRVRDLCRDTCAKGNKIWSLLKFNFRRHRHLEMEEVYFTSCFIFYS